MSDLGAQVELNLEFLSDFNGDFAENWNSRAEWEKTAKYLANRPGSSRAGLQKLNAVKPRTLNGLLVKFDGWMQDFAAAGLITASSASHAK